MSHSSLVKSFSTLSLVTSDSAIFEKTIVFYEQFGLARIHFFDYSNPSSSRERTSHSSHTIDSIKETWLNAIPDANFCHSDAVNDFGVTIKIRLTSTSSPKSTDCLNLPADKADWRSVMPEIVFESEDLKSCIEIFKKSKTRFQVYPTIDSPVELVAQDPLGNLIAFSTQKPLLPLVEKSLILNTDLKLPFTKSDVSNLNQTRLNICQVNVVNPQKRRRIAVMTSGGDAPGMNAAVRAVVRTAIYHGCEAYAIFEGYEGLLKGGNFIKKMDWDDVRGWLGPGGTFIGTARSAGFRERSGRKQAAKNMIINGIDALIVCGGDGSLTGANKFREEWPLLLEELVATKELTPDQAKSHKHLYICGLVGSIDNDMASTDATIGAYSSLDRICEAVDYIDATAQSSSEAFIIEVMGRHCGWLALMAGIAAGADFIFIPEQPPHNKEWQTHMCEIVMRHRANGKRKTIVIVAEGAINSNLEAITVEKVKKVLDSLELDTRITTLGHIQRGGHAVAADRLLATLQGVEAVNSVLSATPDTPSPMIGITENKIVRRSLVEAVAATQEVAKAITNKDFSRAMSMRDAEFADHFQNFLTINSADQNCARNPAQKPLNIAVVTVGAPAGGMNSAIHGIAAYCLSRGHKPYAIQNGWMGLIHNESVEELSWIKVQNWMIRGGCEIGTNRNMPDTDMGRIAYYFQKYKFDGLIIIGGFEAFASLHQLEEARTLYPAFKIPMVCIPATISNNVPGTDYSLGTDTCMNSLVNYCDVIKQSASASRRRVFVVEVQGGKSGFVAAYASLVTGADAVYLPEEGISLSQLEADIESIKKAFEDDQGKNNAGKLILRNEKSSRTLSTEIIVNLICDEAKGKFDARAAIPGHVQQGGNPSPIDRVRATRFAVQACQFIENNQIMIENRHLDSEELHKTAVVLGVRSSKLVYSPINYLWAHETEVKERRPKIVHWMHLIRIADRLVGRNKLRK